MIAVLLNVGGGVRLIKPAKLYMCMQKHYKHKEDGRTAPGCVRQWFRTAEPLGERRYENWNTRTLPNSFNTGGPVLNEHANDRIRSLSMSDDV